MLLPTSLPLFWDTCWTATRHSEPSFCPKLGHFRKQKPLSALTEELSGSNGRPLNYWETPVLHFWTENGGEYHILRAATLPAGQAKHIGTAHCQAEADDIVRKLDHVNPSEAMHPIPDEFADLIEQLVD